MSFVPSGQAGEEATHADRDAALRQAQTRAEQLDGVTMPAGWWSKLLSKLLRRRP